MASDSSKPDSPLPPSTPDNVIRVDFARGRPVAQHPASLDNSNEDTGLSVHSLPGAHDTDAIATSSALPETTPATRRHLHAFSSFIDLGVVTVTVDTRVPGVSVPASLAGQPNLLLNFSYRYHIPDFAYDDDGVRATLGFDDGDFMCVLPWASIYMMVSNATRETFIAPEHFPEELRIAIGKMVELGELDDPDDL